MADQPTQRTPGRTELSDDVGAHSVYDPAPTSPASASAAALAAHLSQFVSGSGDISGSGDVAANVSGVTRSVAQTPGLPPVIFHTAGLRYEIPLGGATPPATRP
jgi:hypothetical protein